MHAASDIAPHHTTKQHRHAPIDLRVVVHGCHGLLLLCSVFCLLGGVFLMVVAITNIWHSSTDLTSSSRRTMWCVQDLHVLLLFFFSGGGEPFFFLEALQAECFLFFWASHESVCFCKREGHGHLCCEGGHGCE